MRGVPRDRRAIVAAPSSVMEMPRIEAERRTTMTRSPTEKKSRWWKIPKRSRSGDDSNPARVVAATMVNGRSWYRRVRACAPFSITKLTQKSSIAGYKNSSTARDSRWISSMNSTSPDCSLVRTPIRSPPRSSGFGVGDLAFSCSAVLFQAVHFLEQLVGRRDSGLAAEGLFDHAAGLGGAVTELLGEDLKHFRLEILCEWLNPRLGPAKQRVLPHLPVQGRDHFLCRALADTRQAAQKLRVFALDGVGNNMDGMHDRFHRLVRPHPVHGDEPLEEFLLDLMHKADQQGLGLILPGAIRNVQLDGLGLPIRRARQRPRHDRREVDLVADATRFHHDHFVGAPQDRTS